ncbi:4Fe-4S ferredoxin [Dethiobacter alkaliphilus]|uniref:4Fe-4S ferredoxin n=1 Tax=Dethiobacter alkaliphilus TaxID=427926 RepID=UPI00222788D5|nr:4Fe-4S ferredoxin [Dethiobacter alkaliphilus]MCW3488931.1 4Fe-4S ferredoxin [Dethiobacter alkaliphilus]
MQPDLAHYIRQTALRKGAVLVGFTKIRKVEPVILLAFPFSDTWFLRQPAIITKQLATTLKVSRHVQGIVAGILRSQGYLARHKSILSVYGDFRPLAVAAGLGEWGRNGIITNRKYGSALLFAATFTNAPLPSATPPAMDSRHCSHCSECIRACPADAFTPFGFSATRCLAYSLKGCAQCLLVCSGKM